jgi:predicted regulator of Ras-like GTPase activity (Roadblock/LC7/MglB family)
MRYRQGISRLIRKGRSKAVGNDLMSIEQAVLVEIKHLRVGLPNVIGVLVAGADGILVAHDLPDGHPETFAAMSAAQLGLAQQVAAAVGRGAFQETITRAEDGYVATFAAGGTALLTVVASLDLNVGLLHHEARPVAARVGAIVKAADRRQPRGPITDPPDLPGPREPLSGLTRRERHGRHGSVAEGSDAD